MMITSKNKIVIEFIILFSLLIVLYIPVIRDLVYAWEIKPQSSHGYLILPISIYLVWRKKEIIKFCSPSPSILGLFFIIFGIFLFLIGNIARISTFSNLSLLLNITGIILALLGKKVSKGLMFPLLFLLFMIPIPDVIYLSLTNPLKLFVSKISADIIDFIGFAVYREGNILHFARTSLEVVEACSGLSSLMSYFMIGFLLAYFLPSKKKLGKAILVVSAIPIALLVNISRIVGTGILSNFYGDVVAKGFFHEFSGMTIFVAGLIFFFGEFAVIQEGRKWIDNFKG